MFEKTSACLLGLLPSLGCKEWDDLHQFHRVGKGKAKGFNIYLSIMGVFLPPSTRPEVPRQKQLQDWQHKKGWVGLESI